MAVRRHVVAGLGIGKDAFAEAFAELGQIEAQATGPWAWFMASVWGVGGDQLLERMARLPITTLHMLTSDGCRWYLNLRGPDRDPFSICYEFYLATTREEDENPDPVESDDASDDDCDDSPGCVSISIPILHNVVGDVVQVAGDDFFNVDRDDGADEAESAPSTPGERMAEDFAFAGSPLPEALISEIRDLSHYEACKKVLRWQVDAILEALHRFDVPHDPDTVRDVLTGASVTGPEWDNDIGNLPRFLVALGFGGTFQDYVEESEAAQLRERESEPAPEPNPVGDILTRLEGCQPVPVDGGAASLSFEEASLLPCLANWVGGLSSATFITVQVPDTGSSDPQGGLSRNTMMWKLVDGVWHISSYLEVSPKDRARIARYLRQLPDDTQVELLFGDVSDESQGQRYTGVIRNGVFELTRTYPRRSARVMKEAMAFLLDADDRVFGRGKGKGWEAESEQEVTDLLDLASATQDFYRDMPQAVGRVLHVEPDNMWNLAELLFRLRFRDVFDLHHLIRQDAELVEELRRMDAEWDERMNAPRTGVVLHQGESVRIDEADVSGLKSGELRKLKSADRSFTALGFTVLGNICTPETGTVIMRAYGQDSGEAYGAVYLNLVYMNGREFFTHFEEGGSLTTTTIDGIESIRRVGLYFRTSAAKDLAVLLEEHRTGIAKLKESGLTPKRAEPTLEAFAAALADALHRRKLADS